MFLRGFWPCEGVRKARAPVAWPVRLKKIKDGVEAITPNR